MRLKVLIQIITLTLLTSFANSLFFKHLTGVPHKEKLPMDHEGYIHCLCNDGERKENIMNLPLGYIYDRLTSKREEICSHNILQDFCLIFKNCGSCFVMQEECYPNRKGYDCFRTTLSFTESSSSPILDAKSELYDKNERSAPEAKEPKLMYEEYEIEIPEEYWREEHKVDKHEEYEKETPEDYEREEPGVEDPEVEEYYAEIPEEYWKEESASGSGRAEGHEYEKETLEDYEREEPGVEEPEVEEPKAEEPEVEESEVEESEVEESEVENPEVEAVGGGKAKGSKKDESTEEESKAEGSSEDKTDSEWLEEEENVKRVQFSRSS